MVIFNVMVRDIVIKLRVRHLYQFNVVYIPACYSHIWVKHFRFIKVLLILDTIADYLTGGTIRQVNGRQNSMHVNAAVYSNVHNSIDYSSMFPSISYFKIYQKDT